MFHNKCLKVFKCHDNSVLEFRRWQYGFWVSICCWCFRVSVILIFSWSSQKIVWMYRKWHITTILKGDLDLSVSYGIIVLNWGFKFFFEKEVFNSFQVFNSSFQSFLLTNFFIFLYKSLVRTCAKSWE